MQNIIKIAHREHLLSTLSEASELEHNLMCLYLYAAFSLKTSEDEDLSHAELLTIRSWHKSIMDVAVQEMVHLALVSNMMTAIGGVAPFRRPEFPVRPGYFPSDFVIQLAPFDEATLEHFIFLERPKEETVADDDQSESAKVGERKAMAGRLMTHVGNYETVGILYEAIELGFETLSNALGESALFCGSKSLQIGPEDVELPGLLLVTDQSSALRAVATIVEQGEGARTSEGSHFETFSKIKDEYQALLAKNPKFIPARPVARNPVMRIPVQNEGHVWVTAAPASEVLDIGNALYNLMLQFLIQIYSMESREAASKKILIEGAFSLMGAVASTGEYLSTLPARADRPGVNAGLTFSLDRYIGAFELSQESRLILERLRAIQRVAERESTVPYLKSLAHMLASIQSKLKANSE